MPNIASKLPPAPTVKRRPSLDFSLTGLIYVLLMIFMGFAAMNTQANLLFGVFGLMIGILIISGSISRLVLKKLRVRRSLPKHGVVGEPMVVYYEFSNSKRYWPSLSVAAAELDCVDHFTYQPQCYMLHAAARMTATVPVELIPAQRGVCELDHFQLSTSFPFGFVKRAMVDHHKDTICIFPALAEVDASLMEMCRAADYIGEAMRPRAGGNDEFYGLREFRAGDNPRHIYWRRSARTGVLVAREMTRVTPPRLILVVDTCLKDDSPLQKQWVERAIAMTASLASKALEQELAVGLCAWSGKTIAIPPSRGKQHREELLTLLACLPPNPKADAMQSLSRVERMMGSGTTLVLITPDAVSPKIVDHPRGGIVVLSAEAEAGRDRFRFGPEVRFE